MQKLLNSSRKLDGKIRKAEADRAHMAEQWKEFQEQLRLSFIARRQKYSTNTQKVELVVSTW